MTVILCSYPADTCIQQVVFTVKRKSYLLDMISGECAAMGANRTNTDQFQLRLPPGLRDRIKAYADRHNRSLNAEIVRVLEREYPEQWPLDVRLTQLQVMANALTKALDVPKLDELGAAIEDMLGAVATGQVSGVDVDTRQKVAEWLADWQGSLDVANTQNYEDALDPEELENRNISGKTAKIVDVDKKA
ncbi:Arc family DNA-binding protein [Rhizobium sp. HT1-10]|uniref:Arc family DNA-binding protein n=1 Tax=Rhizobium sp. HT1-10 TaxID=3111638 RepID=UPI003C2310FD